MERTTGGGGRLSRDQIRDIADRVNIVDVVGDYVTLRKRGASFVGLCPFHQEKTPSFNVHPGRQSFHCFGCHEGGDVFDFLQKIDGMTFMESLEEIARRAGVELPRTRELSPGDVQRARQRTSLYEVNEIAAEAFQRALAAPDGAGARGYLEQRGMSSALVERYGLGFAPDAWETVVQELRRRRVDERLGEQAGLLRPGKRGGYYDLFRNRLMIPITDTRGKVVAFGGRTLGDDERKYMNSPESSIYDKSATLYGLSQAYGAIRRADRAIVVEGYFDCLSLVAAGIENAVAICGTALTPAQVRLLQRYTREVTLVLDGDEAGTRAAFRSLEVLLDQGLWPMFVGLPDGQDPDDFVRAHGAGAFLELIERAEPLLDRYLAHMLEQYRGHPQAAERVLEAVAPTVGRLKPVTAQPYWTWLADRLRVDERLVLSHVRGLRRGAAARGPEPVVQPRGVSARRAYSPEEWALLELLLQHPFACAETVAQARVADALRSPDLADLVRAATDAALAGQEPDVARLLDRTDDPRLRTLLTELSLSEPMVSEDEGAVEQLRDQLVQNIRRAHLQRLLDEAKRQSRHAATDEDKLVAVKEVIRLSRLIAGETASL